MRFPLLLSLLALLGTVAVAQQPDPAAAPAQDNAVQIHQSGDQTIYTEPMAQTPVYRVNVVERTARAVDYRYRGGSTKVDLQGTQLEPQITGDVKVTGHTGRLALDVDVHHLQPARNFGPIYLSYVLWGITPEGRAVNLGEVIPNDDHDARLQVTTALQAFGMIVTAEPYFAVTRPSDVVVAENIIPNDVKGWPRPIEAKFEALQRGEYSVDVNSAELPAINFDKHTPLSLLEARNAVAIAKAAGADRYAADTLQKATDDLNRAEDYYRRKQSDKAIGTMARAAAQAAEDARLLTIEHKRQEAATAARQEMQERIANAKSDAEAARERAELARMKAQQEAEQREQAEEQREAAKREAKLARQERAAAQADLQQAEQARQSAEQQRQQLAEQAQQAQQQAQQAEQARVQVEQQAQQERARLLEQLNNVLQTQETARGLVSRMPDVLFATNQATLRPEAKIRLAKVAGIIMAYPDLKLEIDGFTDNTGTAQYNEGLSQERAAAVRDFLVNQGVQGNNVMTRGFGESEPIASNATRYGRQQNRRVELVVSGNAIGMGPATTGTGEAASTGRAVTGGTSGALSQPSATGTTSAPGSSISSQSTTTTTTTTSPVATPSGTTSVPATSPPATSNPNVPPPQF